MPVLEPGSAALEADGLPMGRHAPILYIAENINVANTKNLKSLQIIGDLGVSKQINTLVKSIHY